jgi:hypothetical protein
MNEDVQVGAGKSNAAPWERRRFGC